jgi:uncharacterized repeat protein (TIGR03803 family)
VIAVGGMLYGTEGGTEGNGKVFSATTEGTVTDLYRFKGSPDGSQPEALTAFHGELYGVTFEGGYESAARPFQSKGCGVLFAITLAGEENVRSPFKCANWDGPHGRLVVDGDALFGETVGNSTSSSDGSIFMARGDGTKSLVYAFPGSDGTDPTDGLVDLNGTLYGTTEYGGKFGDGTVFAVLPNGTVHVIFDFNGADGQFPIGGLTAVDGALYGMTYFGGSESGGTVFTLTTTGNNEHVLQYFGKRSPYGAYPASRLIAMGGALFGTTSAYGSNGKGVIFELSRGGTATALHSFGGADGNGPSGDLAEVGNALYGTTEYGGLDGGGTLFRITP